MSDEKGPLVNLFGVYVGDEMLPSHAGIMINHYKDPY